MEQHQTSPQPPALSSVEGRTLITPRHVRHDGWTGEKMAIFCEALAETAVVAEACDEAGMGISGAYAARRRNRSPAPVIDLETRVGSALLL